MPERKPTLTLDSSRRAKQTLDVLRRFDENGGKFVKEDLAFLKGLPVMLMQNGLGQTMAFLTVKSKKEDANGKKEILRMLAGLLEIGGNNVVQTVVDMKADLYVEKQRQAILFAGYLKQYALALFEPEEGGTA